MTTYRDPATYSPRYAKERERRLKRSKEYGAAHRERGIKYSRAYYEKNRERMIQYGKERYKRPGMRERVRHNQFLRHYGITLEQYTARLTEQGGVCAICRKAETAMYRGQIKMLAVDHDHETEAVRGLLCSLCNIVLGAARDDTSLLQRAINYLASDY